MRTHKQADCIGFSQYRKHSIGQIIFNYPDFTLWMLSHPDPKGQLETTADEARTLIHHFDNKPLTCKCRQNDCDETATEIYVSKNSLILHCWCADCAARCANGYREIASYKDAINFANNRRDGMVSDTKRLIHRLATAKGFTGRYSKKKIRRFLTGSDVVHRDTVRPYATRRYNQEPFWMREDRV